jgi:glutamyl-tRNA reductase
MKFNIDNEGLKVFSIGINHHTAHLELREKMFLSGEETIELLNIYKKHLDECFILSTCNRTEIYGVPVNTEFNINLYKDVFLKFKSADTAVNANHLYDSTGEDAVTHLFCVSSGVDSLVIGDSQILHQVKEAYGTAQKNGSAGKVLNKLCQAALHTGKRAKTETALHEGAVSISYAAVELATKIFGELKEKTVLVIGAGETASLTIESLIKKNVEKIFITNRTKEKAEELFRHHNKSGRLKGNVIEFSDFKKKLNEFDIIITSTAAPGYILNNDDFTNVTRKKTGTPILIADIAIPRDVDPMIGKFGNIFLKDIDDLNAIVEANFELRRKEIPEVRRIIGEELHNFNSWYYNLQLVPTIREIENQFEEIRAAEILNNTNGFSETEKEAVENITKNIVHKILRTTVPHLNQLLKETDIPDQHERYNRVKLIRRIFGLDKQNQKQ